MNHDKAYRYVHECIHNNIALDEKTVKDIHAILTENIMIGGVYRNEQVYISGAAHRPPPGTDMFIQIKNFFADLLYKEKQMNPIELAAWTHAELVRIHPFINENGRTSRLLMNYQLLGHEFLPINIKKEEKLKYYEALENYAVEKDLKPFADMIYELEAEQLDKYNNAYQQVRKSAPIKDWEPGV